MHTICRVTLVGTEKMNFSMHWRTEHGCYAKRRGGYRRWGKWYWDYTSYSRSGSSRNALNLAPVVYMRKGISSGESGARTNYFPKHKKDTRSSYKVLRLTNIVTKLKRLRKTFGGFSRSNECCKTAFEYCRYFPADSLPIFYTWVERHVAEEGTRLPWGSKLDCSSRSII